MELKKLTHLQTTNRDQPDRLLRDSHLDLKIESLKENSHLILNLDSQFFHENSHENSRYINLVQI